MSGSPAINTGDNSLLPADITDIDGDGDTTEPIPYDLVNNPRIVGEAVDMGAYEVFNIPPVAVDDTYNADEDTPLIEPDPGVLFNDYDLNGDNLIVTENTQPAHGSATVNPDGSFTYTPDQDFFGEDTFGYTICDDGTPSLCDSATVTVNVRRVIYQIFLPLIFH